MSEERIQPVARPTEKSEAFSEPLPPKPEPAFDLLNSNFVAGLIEKGWDFLSRLLVFGDVNDRYAIPTPPVQNNTDDAEALARNVGRFDAKPINLPKKMEKKEKVVVVVVVEKAQEQETLIAAKKEKKAPCAKKVEAKQIAAIKNDVLAEAAKPQPVEKAKPMPLVTAEAAEEKEVVAKAAVVETDVNPLSAISLESTICVSGACHLFSFNVPSEVVRAMPASLVGETQKREELAVNSVAVEGKPFFAIPAPILNASVIEIASRNAMAGAGGLLIKIAEAGRTLSVMPDADPMPSPMRSDKISGPVAEEPMTNPKIGGDLGFASMAPLAGSKESDHSPDAIFNFVGSPGIPPKGVSVTTAQASGQLLKPEQRVVADTYPESSRDSRHRGEGESRDRGREQQAEQEEENESAAT